MEPSAPIVMFARKKRRKGTFQYNIVALCNSIFFREERERERDQNTFVIILQLS